MSVLLTHDLKREGGGDWVCVNCGARGSTIAAVSAEICTRRSNTNQNVLDAIAGTGKFAKKD